MIRRAALTLATVLAGLSLSPARAEVVEPPGPPQTDATPIAYRIDLTIDPAQTVFMGHVEIEMSVAGGRVVSLNGLDLRVTKVSANISSHTIPGTYRQIDSDGHAQIEFAQSLPTGRVTLVIDYSADIHDWPPALFRARVGRDWYVGSYLVPTAARRVFPCFDHINLKAPFRVTLTVPKGLMAVSNMPEASSTSDGPNERHIFRESPPLPTYLVSFAVGRFAVASAMIPATPQRPTPLPLRVLAPRADEAKLEYTLTQTSSLVQRLEQLFGLPFPYPKLDQIASPVVNGGMENAGAVIYGEDSILPGDHASSRSYGSFGFLVSHELAHQWFGDSVTPIWWDDIWLKESFADWAAAIVATEWHPDIGIVARHAARVVADMEGDSLPGSRAMRQPLNEANANSGYDGAYGKGSQLLEMVEEYIGSERFRQGTHDYLVLHANGSATARDFFAALAKAAGEPAIVQAMQTFTDQPGVPTLDLQRTGRTLKIHQHRYAALGVDLRPQTWIIPYCFKQADRKHCIMIDRENTEIKLDRDTAIVPNADGAGYFRFNLSDADWRQLLANERKLTVGEALAVNDSLWSAFAAGRVGAASLLEATYELAASEDPDVAVSSGHRWMDLRARGIVPDSAIVQYKTLFSAAYGPVLGTLGFDPEAGHYLGENPGRTRLRAEIVRVLAAAGADPGIERTLRNATQRLLAGDEKALDRSFTAAGLEVYLRLGGRAAGEELLKKALASEDAGLRGEILRALGSSDRKEIGEWLLGSLGHTGLRLTEELRLMKDLLRYSHTSEPTLTWLQGNYARLTKLRLGLGWGPFIASTVCASGDEERVEKIMRPEAPAGTNASFELDLTLETIHRCVRLREAKADELVRALGGR